MCRIGWTEEALDELRIENYKNGKDGKIYILDDWRRDAVADGGMQRRGDD